MALKLIKFKYIQVTSNVESLLFIYSSKSNFTPIQDIVLTLNRTQSKKWRPPT